MEFKINNVKNKFKGGYIGMNSEAAKHFKIPYQGKKTIQVYSKLPPEVKKHTIKHEKIEYLLMKQGKNYHNAHKIALKHENTSEQLKTIIKKYEK